MREVSLGASAGPEVFHQHRVRFDLMLCDLMDRSRGVKNLWRLNILKARGQILVLGLPLLDLKVTCTRIVLVLFKGPTENFLLQGTRELLACLALGPIFAKTMAVIPHDVLDEVTACVDRPLLARPRPVHHAEELLAIVWLMPDSLPILEYLPVSLPRLHFALQMAAFLLQAARLLLTLRPSTLAMPMPTLASPGGLNDCDLHYHVVAAYIRLFLLAFLLQHWLVLLVRGGPVLRSRYCVALVLVAYRGGLLTGARVEVELVECRRVSSCAFEHDRSCVAQSCHRLLVAEVGTPSSAFDVALLFPLSPMLSIHGWHLLLLCSIPVVWRAGPYRCALFRSIQCLKIPAAWKGNLVIGLIMH